MPDITAERLAQLCFDTGIVSTQDLDKVWGEVGRHDASYEQFSSILLRKELLTNWQLERIASGIRDGYFYGDYKILYLVGAGTFSRVYRAVDHQSGNNTVRAVKVLRLRYSDDISATEQFLREARLVMPLRHPNIVPVQHVDSQRGRYYMVMDFVEGQNLRDFVKLRKHMELGEALKIISDITSGLAHALNEGGITHRDLKLSNVLISSRGRAKLVDFGLASMVKSDAKTDKEFANAANPRSIDYAGLERATHVPRNDPRSDVFFVGCMLYHMLAGHPPLSETRDRIQRLNVSRYRDIPPISKYVRGLPTSVLSIINKAISFDPDKRYPNHDKMLLDLKAVIGAEGVLLDRRSNDEESEEGSSTQKRRGEIKREGEGRTILLVDPRESMQQLLRKQLGDRGYRILVMTDAQRAVARLHDEPELVDCAIFCTAELGKDGLDAFNMISETPRTQRVPAILIAERDQHQFASSANLSNLQGMLQMPLKMRQLRAALLQLISRKDEVQAG